MDVAKAISILTNSPAVQVAFTTLAFLSALWPKQASVKDGDCFDFIVIGCGTAGSVIVNRLTEVNNFNVLCIEAGGDPPLTSMLPLLFPLLANSPQDWKYRSQNDRYTAQKLVNNTIELTSGKMLGGSSSLDHMFHVLGSPVDFSPWAEAVKDKSWDWEGILKYYKKSESMRDEEILDSPFKSFHGTNGYVEVAREPDDKTLPYLKSFEELGNKVTLDLIGTNGVGYTQPLFTIYNKHRQSNAYAYLTPVKERPNLHVLKDTKVLKIIFDDDVAVRVEIVVKNERISLIANKEIIVTAGTFNSPQLLMLSGIGPKQHLESLGINVIVDLPVGENYQDHPSITILHKMEKSLTPDLPPNPFKFPVPAFVGFVALNKSQQFADYLTLNGIVGNDEQYKIFLFCSVVFQYKDEICKKMLGANIGRNVLYTIHSLLHPKSRGKLLLKSTDPADPPLINTGLYSDVTDLDNHAKFAEDFARVITTDYFDRVGAELVDLDLPECVSFKPRSREYWRCYILCMSTTTYHYSSTCSMGKVVDNKLRVKGLKGIRVADASVMTTTTGGNIKAAVNAIAEKAADLIKNDYYVSAKRILEKGRISLKL